MSRGVSLLLLLLLPLILVTGSCATSPVAGGAPLDREQAGKIHIRYQYQAADLDPLPAGFNVYRAEDSAGPFARINGKLIKAMRSPRPGETQLLMTDTGVLLGDRYYYYIEKVLPDGRAHKATSVAAAVANLPQFPGDGKRLESMRDED